MRNIRYWDIWYDKTKLAIVLAIIILLGISAFAGYALLSKTGENVTKPADEVVFEPVTAEPDTSPKPVIPDTAPETKDTEARPLSERVNKDGTSYVQNCLVD